MSETTRSSGVHRPPRPRRSRSLLAGLFGVVAVALTACAAPSEGAPPPTLPQRQPAGPGLTAADVDAWLDGVVAPALRTTGIPGAAVAVVADGEILTARAYGMADTGTMGDPARQVEPDETLFRMGSVSKTFTATAVLRLVEEGQLDLDADVAQYLDVDLDLPYGPVTLRHLLTHTAGFEERLRGLIGVEEGVSLRDAVVTDPPEQVYVPGTVPAYSNYGIALAGYVVERAGGVPFAEYVARHVLEPAGMTSSAFEQPLPDDLAGRLARGYPDDSQPPVPFEHVADSPAGSLSATITDMGRFMLAQLGEPVTGTQVLAPETLDLLHAPGLGTAELGALAAAPGMALGFFDESRGGHRAVGHGGDTQVFHTAMRIFPDDGVGVVVAFNGTGRDPVDAHALRYALVDGFADRYVLSTNAEPEPMAHEGTRDGSEGDVDAGLAERAAAVEGTYESARVPRSTFASLMRLTVQSSVTARADGTLLVTPRPDGFTPAVYEEVEPGLWQEVGGEERLAVRTEDGRVTAIAATPAGTLLRVDLAHDASFAVPVVAASLLVLVAAALAWPVGALVRRRYGVERPGRQGRVLRVLTRVGVGAALVATAGWVVVASSMLAFQDVPDAPLRWLQLLQLVGALAVVPAAWRVVEAARTRAGVGAVLGRSALALSLVGLAWFALAFGLIAVSVSY